MGERLIHCDVSELANVPVPSDPVMTISILGGRSTAQDKFGEDCRAMKLPEWRPDLPENVYVALLGCISDPTWWIANRNVDASGIKWPESWVGLRNQQPTTPPPPQHACFPGALAEERGAKKPAASVQQASCARLQDIEQFKAYAMKAARSPELAYLTIMALAWRNTKDNRILALFVEAREKVEGHLQAIDDLLGSPGAE
jgi:hypothetical protein